MKLLISITDPELDYLIASSMTPISIYGKSLKNSTLLLNSVNIQKKVLYHFNRHNVCPDLGLSCLHRISAELSRKEDRILRNYVQSDQI